MRCPECKSLNEAGSSACGQCGLLLLKLTPAKRRSDDFAATKRRASDQSLMQCPFCGGEIQNSAARCLHCAQIVKAEARVEQALRRRAQINYASWIAYIFGLIAFVVFKPVGIVSIAAGLLLSIAYYAIPIERVSKSDDDEKEGFWDFAKRQVRLERIAIAIPRIPGRKLVFVGTPLIAATIGFLANFFLLQQPMNKILAANSAYDGMSVSAHYRYFFIPGEVTYDLRSIGSRQSTLDVHTALLEYAKTLKGRRFRNIRLSYQGVDKFSIAGDKFQKLGEEYDRRNFAYVLLDFPKLYRRHSGKAPAKQQDNDRDALHEFHQQWYAEPAPALGQ